MLETIRPYGYPLRTRAAIFDFDGTLSLIRSGWMPLMVSQFVDEITSLKTGENKRNIEERVSEIVLQLTGKETIHQMNALTEEIRARGGNPQPAAEYKTVFLERLAKITNARKASLRNGSVEADRFIVPGARAALDFLKGEGIELYLASGTDEDCVKEEAALLKIDRYFGDRTFGARDDGKGFTKAALVSHLLNVTGLRGSEIVGFGDGYVEINEVSKAGGFAIGVATDEPECKAIEPGKRRHLIAAGAHVIMPNYTGTEWRDLVIASKESVPAGVHSE